MTFDKQAARARVEWLQDYYRKMANGYHPECEPICVSEAAEMLPAALDRIDELEGRPKSGLFGKYVIAKADGARIDPNADYFVLRLDTDPIARIAANEYAIQTPDEKLCKDLRERVLKYLIKGIDGDHVARREDSWPLAALRQDEIVFGHLNDLIAIARKRIMELEAAPVRLTAEQQAALKTAIKICQDRQRDHEEPSRKLSNVMAELRLMLSQSVPVWEITEERKATLESVRMLLKAISIDTTGWEKETVVLQAMIDEVKEKCEH